ncbi:MAG: hypothetical protein GF411_08420 [Candidatus Lokiarchaeota archaeon]|nr:hypothetical protein [Candidatus Lokiarchaeota archaeon]
MICQITKKQLVYFCLITVCISFMPTNGEHNFANQTIETRAVWLNDYAFNSDNIRNDTINKIRTANLNTVFLIAPPIGGNKGWSDPNDFAVMLDVLSADGLSVHAWIANLYRLKGVAADFTNETEQIQQISWVKQLLTTYPKLDGIHFDYIRSKELETVNSTQMNAISDLIGQAKVEISNLFPDKFLTTAGWPLSGEIRASEDQLPQWYIDWFNEYETDSVNRWNKAGYNHDGYPTCFGVQQDPVDWIANEQLDYHISMEYCFDTDWWKGEVDIWNTFPEEVVEQTFMGLGWYSGVWQEETITQEQVATEIVNKIRYGRLNNISGFSIFELNEPENNDSLLIDALSGDSTAPFYTEATSAFKATIKDNGNLPNYTLIILIAIIGGFSAAIALASKRRK